VKKEVRSVLLTVENVVKKRKIIIIGDSYAKGSAANIKRVLGKSAVVIGYVSTGAKLNNITSVANNEIS
jgi:hypothetical protein